MIGPFDGEHEWLSNFYPCRVRWGGVVYPSVENAFQAAKFAPEDRSYFFDCTPAQAKRRAGVWKKAVRSDWYEMRDDVMLNLTIQKYCQSQFAQRLLATGHEEIVEINWWNDVYWGRCNGIGENRLGKIIERVRTMLEEL